MLASLLTAHVLCDFYFQTDTFCDKKSRNGLKGKEIYAHAAIVFVMSMLSAGQASFWWMALVVSLLHLLIDWLKIMAEERIRPKEGGSRLSLKDSRYVVLSFATDQILHMIVLGAATLFWLRLYLWQPYGLQPSSFHNLLGIVLSLLICGKPANIMVKLVLRYCSVTMNQGHDQHGSSPLKTGALIGNLERWLVVFFVCIDQYEAIGFLIAAKSILRFNELKGSEKSEYVLTGTLLSLFIAISCGFLLHLSLT